MKKRIAMSVFGVGTIITAFCMGPLIEVFTKFVAEPLLHNKNDFHR